MKILSIGLFLFLQVVCLSVEEEKNDVGFQPVLRKTEEIQESYKKLNELLKKVTAKSQLTLYVGLPHPMRAASEYAVEKKTAKTTKRYGFLFYKEAKKIHKDDIVSLKKTVKHPQAFQKYTAAKGCGGFHPDFALVYTDGKETVEIHLCFGCGEMKIFHGKTEVYCEMSQRGKNTFKFLLDQYTKTDL